MFNIMKNKLLNRDKIKSKYPKKIVAELIQHEMKKYKDFIPAKYQNVRTWKTINN